MNRKTTQSNLGIAACAISVTPTGEVQLFPAGKFRASDGRPKDVPHWYINAEIAASIIADFETRQNLTVIDYEHQTILTAQNGQPAPAAAWFGELAWRDTGLYVVDAQWTERASQMIEAGEYRYISPVFLYDKKTGAVTRLLHAALTNNPALDGMDAVAASQFTQLINQQNNQEKLSVEELLNNLRWMLNMPVTATQEEIVAELQKAIDQIKSANATVAANANFSLIALIHGLNNEIAVLKATAGQPDPARFVPITVMKSLQDELTSLKAEKLDLEVSDVVEVALSEGKLLPVQEEWARNLGKENLASLKAYLASAQPIAALTGTQTGGRPPEGNSHEGELTDDQLTLCKVMGITAEDFKKNMPTA